MKYSLHTSKVQQLIRVSSIENHACIRQPTGKKRQQHKCLH